MGRKSKQQIKDETQREIFQVLNSIYSDEYISSSEFRYKTVQLHRELIYKYGNSTVDNYFKRFIQIEKMINGV